MTRPSLAFQDEMLFREMDCIVNSVVDACCPKVPMDICIEHIDGKSVIALEVFPGTRATLLLEEGRGLYCLVYPAYGLTAEEIAVVEKTVSCGK